MGQQVQDPVGKCVAPLCPQGRPAERNEAAAEKMMLRPVCWLQASLVSRVGQRPGDVNESQVRSSAALFGSRDFLGQDYLIRAVAVMIGIYGNAAEEFLGVGYQTDSDGNPLHRGEALHHHFPLGRLSRG